MTTTKTTVREYDDKGRMVKETVTEVDDVQVFRSRQYCNCSGAGTYCPVHGYSPAYPPSIVPRWGLTSIVADDGHTITVNSGVN